MRPGPLDSPTGLAWEASLRRGTCPMAELDESHFDRWDVVTLCGAFPCAECVAEPGDWEPCEPPSEPCGGVGQDVELPF